MFESKQSDYWYKEDTKEFLVCAITSVSAEGPPCKGDLIAHFPCIYSIDRDTNRKKLIFPNDVSDCSSAQLTAEDSPGYVYSFVPETSADINLSEISKPVISYNERSDFYNITYLGKYTDSADGFAIFSYIFQYVNEFMYPVHSRVILPESKNTDLNFTFADGNLHKDYFIQGNETKGENTLFGILTAERPPNYMFRPFHYNNDLKFSTITYATTSTEVTANSTLPMGYAGGFIAKKKETPSYKTNNCIRVDFTCKSYTLAGNDQLGFLSTRSTSGSPVSSYRSIKQYTLSAGPAEGFCVFFYTPDSETELQLNGVNSSLGYCPSDYNQFEVGGSALFGTDGINLSGYIGVAFDIAGNFCTTTEGKNGKYDGTTFTQTACCIGVRSGVDNEYKAIGQSNQITTVALHETVASAANAVYRDFRVELSRQGKVLVVSGKLSTDPEYTELYRLNMSTLPNYSFNIPDKLKVGLSCTTSEKVFNFELKSFKVEGITD